MNGYLKIKTKVENKDLISQLKYAKKELFKFKKEAENLTNKKLELEAKINLDDSEFRNKVNAINEKRDRELLSNTKYYDGKPYVESNIETKINNKYDNQISSLMAQYENKAEKINFELDKIEEQISKNESQQEIWNNKVNELNQESKKIDFGSVQNSIENSSKSISNVIKKVGKWALAVFSVRSAYSFIRSSISTISQYDQQLATDIEYIRYALAMTLKPVIEWIIDAVKTLMYYVGYLANKWFNVDLWANSSTKGFKSANVEAKKLQKTLAGFDEVNVLSDGSSASGGGVSMPSFDVSKMDDKLPKWMIWLGENRDLVLAIIGFLLAFKVIGKIFDLANIVSAIGSATAGTGLAGICSMLGWILGLAIIAIEIYVIGDAIKQIVEIKKGIKELSDNVQKNTEQSSKVVHSAYSQFTEDAKNSKKSAEEIDRAIQGMTETLSGNSKMIRANTDSLSKNNSNAGRTTGIYYELVNILEKQHQKQMINIQDLYELAQASNFNDKSVDNLNIELFKELKNLEYLNSELTVGTEEYKKNEKRIEAVKNVMKILDYKSKIKELEEMNKKLDKNSIEYETNESTIKDLNNTIRKLEDKTVNINLKANADTTEASSKFANLFGGVAASISKFGSNSTPSSSTFKKIFGLATGGIVDVPRTGVPLASNVVAGEAGAEGVIPLTDDRALNRIADAIGNRITLNVDLTNTIDGRVLNNRLEQVRADNRFARNGGV